MGICICICITAIIISGIAAYCFYLENVCNDDVQHISDLEVNYHVLKRDFDELVDAVDELQESVRDLEGRIR